jgi:hypothetical protein
MENVMRESAASSDPRKLSLVQLDKMADQYADNILKSIPPESRGYLYYKDDAAAKSAFKKTFMKCALENPNNEIVPAEPFVGELAL